jgi:hypothetical protein
MGYTTPDFTTEPVGVVTVESTSEVFLLDNTFFEVDVLVNENLMSKTELGKDFLSIESKLLAKKGSGCAEYSVPCCGTTITYQWCSGLPGFEPTAFLQGVLYCDQLCGGDPQF